MRTEALEHEERKEWVFWNIERAEIFSVINKLEEIRIPCECVGGSILEAIPNILTHFPYALYVDAYVYAYVKVWI